jgi:very-short-patch-repair endonuclease
LNARGYIVMRFLNQQAVSEAEAVMQSILARRSADTPPELVE